MISDINYEATHSHPGMSLNSAEGKIELYGRSIPENAIAVYKPIMNWLENYAVEPRKKTTLNFKIEFFNTSSSKFILQILKKLEDLYNQGFEVEINWFYNDEDIKDLAEDYEELVKMEFNYYEAMLK
jgi:hypothetical protein